MRVEIVLQDDRRGGRVQPGLAHTPVLFPNGEAALSLPAGQPLVLQHDREAHPQLETVGELLDLGGHVGWRAIQPFRQPYNQQFEAVVFIGKMRQRRRQPLDRSRTKTLHVKRLERPGQDPGGIADRDTDSSLTNIQPRDAHAALYYPSTVMQQARVSPRRQIAESAPTPTAAGLICAALGLVAFCAPLYGQQSQTLAPGPPPAPQDRAIALQTEAESLARESRTLLGELRKLEVERDLQRERARQAVAAVAAATAALTGADSKLAELDQRRAAQAPDLRVRLVNLYKRGRSGNVRLLLGASSVRDFARTTRTVASMARDTEVRLEEHRTLLANAQAERAARAQALASVQAESRKAEQGRLAAVAAVRARAALLSDIDRRRDLTAQLAGELQVAARKLDEQVISVANSPAPTAPSPGTAVTPRLPVRGGLEWPIDGRISGRFGEASARMVGSPPRNGIEIDTAEGTPVRAIHPGSVVFASAFPGFGTLVIIDHSRGYHSVYGYLSSTTLSPGDAIDTGREVGRVGSMPGGPPALYFEFRIDGRSVDPIQWLRPR